VLRYAAIFAAVALLLSLAPMAVADPDSPPDPNQVAAAGGAVIDAPTLSFEDLGESNALSFYRSTSDVSVSFPVPPGLVPAALNVTLDLPFNIRSGLLTVTQQDRLISKLPLPLADLTPLIIPLPGVEVVNNTASLTLTLSSLPDDGYCVDWSNPVELINGSVTYFGTELPPTTVADFIPAILRKLTIGIPSNPTQAESDAAVQLAARLTRRYGGQFPEVLVVPLADGATAIDNPSVPLERQVIIKEGPDAAVSLVGSAGVPQLLISGPADKLTNLSLLFATGALDLAVSQRVVPDKVRSARWPELPGDTITLAGLGEVGGLNARGLSPQVTIDINQPRFGRSIQGIRVHLLGTYTPIPNTLGAQVTASVGGETIDSWPTDAAAAIDHWVQIPDRLVTRFTQLQVSVDTTRSSVVGCNDYGSMMLRIDGNSVIETSTAAPPLPAGFGSLPQALMPVVRVGIGADKFADTVRATQIVVGLGRLSPLPFRTAVMPLDEARASQDSAILISADGWTDNSITLPVSSNDRQITVQGQAPGEDQTVLTLDPGMAFGSLQTVFDGRRTLLVATSNGAPAQLDDLLTWLNADRARWSQLRGNAVVDVVGRPPTLVLDRTPVNVYGPVSAAPKRESATSGSYQNSPAWWVAALVVGVAAGGVGAIALSSQRSGAGTSSSSSSHRRGE
jgi:hypothetical protein